MTTSTSSTSSTSTTTTTTTPVRIASPGPVTLGETGLEFDTGSLVQFGQGEEAVLTAIAGVLGDPDSDSGPTENDFCAGPTARFVRFSLKASTTKSTSSLRFCPMMAKPSLTLSR